MASYIWSDALINAINNVHKRVLTTELAVVIKDKYPKAMHHFLVLPWKDIDSVYDLTCDDEGLLEEMYKLAVEAADMTGLPADRFEFGYHMKPSMRRLHLHVISKDYHSPCLSHPYHWTAFNTDFFMKHEYVVERIRTEGLIERPHQKRILELLDTPLQCNQCTYRTTIFQELKHHLKQHLDGSNSEKSNDPPPSTSSSSQSSVSMEEDYSELSSDGDESIQNDYDRVWLAGKNQRKRMSRKGQCDEIEQQVVEMINLIRQKMEDDEDNNRRGNTAIEAYVTVMLNEFSDRKKKNYPPRRAMRIRKRFFFLLF